VSAQRGGSQAAVSLLGEDHVATAQKAHSILGTLELPADRVLGVWTKALSHSDEKVRAEAISALATLRAAARPAKAALLEQLKKEKNYYNKAGIHACLTLINPDDPDLVPRLIRALDDPESWVRWNAIDTLARLGPRAKAAIAEFEKRLLNPGKEGKPGSLSDSNLRDLVGGIVRIAPG
jgi:HEAT repeat protein